MCAHFYLYVQRLSQCINIKGKGLASLHPSKTLLLSRLTLRMTRSILAQKCLLWMKTCKTLLFDVSISRFIPCIWWKQLCVNVLFDTNLLVANHSPPGPRPPAAASLLLLVLNFFFDIYMVPSQDLTPSGHCFLNCSIVFGVPMILIKCSLLPGVGGTSLIWNSCFEQPPLVFGK